MELNHTNLTIWQQNVNKSPTCQHDIISSKFLIDLGANIVALQEPAINQFGKTIATKDWTPIYPTTHNTHPKSTQSVILIKSTLMTNSWQQLDSPSGDVTIIQVTGNWGKLTILNIYNDCEHNRTINLLSDFHHRNAHILGTDDVEAAHCIWLGDFNRHHPYWDDPEDTRLFTREAINAAETLIEAVAEAGLEMALPSGTSTHQHHVTKRWSRLDNVFISDHSMDALISCDAVPEQRGTRTDHLPIITKLNLAAQVTPPRTTRNFRNVNWEQFQEALERRLVRISPPLPINTQPQLDKACADLTKALQDTIASDVPTTTICAKSKRWWTKELTMLRKKAKNLGRQSHKNRDKPFHYTHVAYEDADKLYHRTLNSTKLNHWRDWLEKAEDPDIWTVQKVLAAPASDGGSSKIPVLRRKTNDTEQIARTNTEKGQMLADSFFPPKPATEPRTEQARYPKQCEKAGRITKESVARQLRKLKPYKAPGPDGIPNIVLTKCADTLTDRLYYIYSAIYDKRLYYEPWKTFNTVVLRKPGKPSYEVPKAYRPIALINTLWKVLTAILAKQLSYFAEKHHLLPNHHFGGRPGRTTTDAMHLLTYKIKGAWRKGQVAAVLFLDIEGAFPNAVPSRLIHNLKMRRVPDKLINFVAGMLQGRITSLKFDDHTSDPIPIDNGIGQGDPLSMALYQFYNADILDIPNSKNESAIAYVDDALLMATAKTFEEAHQMLSNMMTRQGGVTSWSTSHNSPLEYSKLALIDFAHQNTKPRPNLQLPQITVKPVTSAKYLGVIFDQNLRWTAQLANVITKGSKWAAQIKRATRPSWGITPKYARRLYISTALPKILYAVDVWCTPLHGTEVGPRTKGSVTAIKRLTTAQRAGTIAITGGLRTSPTDALDACANTIPASLLVEKWCFKAAVRLATLPPEHPLYKPVKASANKYIRRHKAPLHNLMQITKIDPDKMEKISIAVRNPLDANKIPLRISIASDKEKSKAESINAPETVKVYTDGSEIKGKVGAAAVLLRPGRSPRVLHYHIGSKTEHTTSEAEMVGLLMGLHLIKTEKAGNTSFALGTDDKEAIRSLTSDLTQPGQKIATEAIKIASQTQRQRNSSRYSITLRWTAGHTGIQGNNKADREAKKAARGTTSDKKLLPHLLKRKLTTNPAAVKKNLNKVINAKWKTRWRNSSRGTKMRTLDDTTPSNTFLNLISNSKLTRKDSSILTQICTGHIPLNSYLYKFKLVDSPKCPACGAAAETIHHFLFTCPSYAHARWPLKQKCKGTLTLKKILANHKLVVALIGYINATERFKRLQSEFIRPDQ